LAKPGFWFRFVLGIPPVWRHRRGVPRARNIGRLKRRHHWWGDYAPPRHTLLHITHTWRHTLLHITHTWRERSIVYTSPQISHKSSGWPERDTKARGTREACRHSARRKPQHK
jgi:hypothetical protein